MKNALAKKIRIILFFAALAPAAHAQKKSAQLENEQKQLEQKLNNTRGLLEKVKTGTKASLNEMKLIDNQVRYREELVQNFDNQIRGAELTISSKDGEIRTLQEKLERMKEQYRRLLIYAYKHRNSYGRMMYIFSATNYFEAVKRNAYLKHFAEIQRKQFRMIRQSKSEISTELTAIRQEKEKKEQLLSEKIVEKNQILKDKEKQQQTLNKLKQDEAKLMAQLKADEQKRAELKRRIRQAIEKEIAEAEEKARKDAAKKTSTASASKGSAPAKTSTSTSAPAAKKEVVITETKESIAMGKNFESNRGKLPWPVLKGTITEGYGKNPHPTMANVYTNNNGIDIGAPKNAQVRAVFDGEVTSVLSIPGAGKVVIIKHGNYRTVYSNLQEAYVSVGTKVSTKQSIGALLPDPEGNLSTAHFEIHQVIDGTVQKVNPTLWLTN
jgi:murein hydrolase activator